MQSQRDMCEVLVILQREQEDRQNFLMTIENLVTRQHSSVGPTATQLIGTATRGCVTLIDATGHQHPISVDFCTSFEVRSTSENTSRESIPIKLSLAIQRDAQSSVQMQLD
jgi:hypothetical protein